MILGISIQLACAAAVSPEPSCKSFWLSPEVPLTEGQRGTVSLSTLFKGFNLSYSIKNSSKIWTLQQKLTVAGVGEVPALAFASAKQYQRGDAYSQEALLYSDDTSSIVYLSELHKEEQVPRFKKLLVQNQAFRQCWDVQLLDNGVVVVDCVKGNKSQLILVNPTDQTIIKRIQGQRFADFGEVSGTKISSWRQGDRHILVRSFVAAAVRYSRNNTYLQLILLQGLEARTVRIIDRTFFGQKQLMIKSVAVKEGFLLVLTYDSLLLLKVDSIWKAHWLALQPVQSPTFLSDIQTIGNSMLFSLSLEHQVLTYRFQLDHPEELVLVRRHSLVSDAITRSLRSSPSYTVLTLQKGTHKEIWVYKPQDRVYSLAFYASPALEPNLTVFYFPRSNFLLKLSQGKSQLWALREPKLTYQVQGQVPGTNSTDQVTTQSTNGFDFVRCVKQIQILFLQMNKRYLISSKIEPPSVYQFNSPGEFYIRLDQYVKGPDISYSLEGTLVDNLIPRHWLLESNKSQISWDPYPPQNIEFIRKESWTVGLFQVFQLFVQNSSDFLHVYNCFGSLANDLLDCTLQRLYPLSSQVRLFSWSRNLRDRYFCLSLQKERNRVVVWQQEEVVGRIETEEGKEGQIREARILGTRLFLLMKYKKQIRVFNIPDCKGQLCSPLLLLDYDFFYRQGFKYFRPLALELNSRLTDRLLVLTDSGAICVEMSGAEGRVLFNVSVETGSSLQAFKAKLFRRFVVIAHKQLGLKVYNIQNSTSVEFNYDLPLYQFSLHSQFLIEQSDFAEQLFLTVRNPNARPFLLVYNLLSFAAESLYKSIPLQTYSDFLEVSGHRVNFVLTVDEDEGVNMVQVYEYPQIVIDSPEKSCSVNFVFSNEEDQVSRMNVRLQISNQPQRIVELNNVTTNKQLLKRLVVAPDSKVAAGVYNFSDKRWWQGNILQYQVKAPDIPSQIQFQDHIHLTRNQPSAKGMTDFIATQIGGFVQQQKSLLYTGRNGSIQKIIGIPSGSSCTLSLNYADIGVVSVCLFNGYQVLYLTTFSSSNGFVQGPFYTSAVSVNSIISCENLLMLLDQQGSVHIYEIEVDPDKQLFSLVQIIDKQQLLAAQEFPGLNPTVVDISARSQNGLFTLLLTELAGFFRITFSHQQYSSRITIASLNYYTFDKIIAPYNRKLPADAALISTYIHPNSTQDRLFLIIVCFDYDAFVGFLQIKDGSFDLKLVAKRYGSYWLQGKPKVQQNYLLVRLMSSPLSMQGRSQLVAIYDIDISTAKSYPQNRYFYGIKLGDRLQFNVLFNYSFSKRKINQRGIVVLYRESPYLKEYRYSENLTLIVKNNSVPSQLLSIAALNDFSRIDFTIPLSLYWFYLQTWQWVLLGFIGSALVVLVVVAVIKWKEKKREAMKIPLLQQSSSEDSQNQRSIFLQDKAREDLIQEWEGQGLPKEGQGLLISPQQTKRRGEREELGQDDEQFGDKGQPLDAKEQAEQQGQETILAEHQSHDQEEINQLSQNQHQSLDLDPQSQQGSSEQTPDQSSLKAEDQKQHEPLSQAQLPQDEEALDQELQGHAADQQSKSLKQEPLEQHDQEPFKQSEEPQGQGAGEEAVEQEPEQQQQEDKDPKKVEEAVEQEPQQQQQEEAAEQEPQQQQQEEAAEQEPQQQQQEDQDPGQQRHSDQKKGVQAEEQ